MTRPQRLPLVVSPTISNAKVGRVLVDGGSSLDLISASVLDEMQVPRSRIRSVAVPFYGIVPGTSVKPLGQITLPVTLGGPANFRTELINFEVVDFKSAYNAILGRPVLSRFMAATHHAYQCLKAPGPNGVITIKGDHRAALNCDEKALDMVGQLPQRGPDQAPARSRPKVTLQPGGETKAVALDEADPSKVFHLGSSLDPK